ncbi:hypothetical protein PPL_00283 [Heterostelium album PN500]|uniref:Right handed beta helix domain-containing protein n=1 Tax=Heterostelium pallidum (strain ATCC 26659 / Pp 5 / PN500) TaxID=670386 RepID=D3AW16_HETP5|nr:hypothetical protein PPL_00283 [Heterostelium album PN500]EFA86489.1 hypothetical protein PPL_00283 [Heterostelium album PN500]|eukprot:XP_020438594.1 hypothetical protein PPL_00283 [Heterostelium album PN500]
MNTLIFILFATLSFQFCHSQWPDQTNTGYIHAPGYPGSLTTCTTPIPSNSMVKYCNFPDGYYVGSGSNYPRNITFIGCRFASNALDDANVAVFGYNITFNYCTFEPIFNITNPSYTQGYQYGIDQRKFAGGLFINYCNIWGFGNGLQLGFSNKTNPIIVTNSWIHNPRADGGIDHTDGILENYGGVSYMTFDHNTIVGVGNTQALGLQGADDPYDHITVTNNLFSGYGYVVSFGHKMSTNIIFTGNVWSSQFEPIHGPMYDSTLFETAGLNNLWKNNTLKVYPGTTWMNFGNNGKYWWATDGMVSNPNQIIGHNIDYINP